MDTKQMELAEDVLGQLAAEYEWAECAAIASYILGYVTGRQHEEEYETDNKDEAVPA